MPSFIPVHRVDDDKKDVIALNLDNVELIAPAKAGGSRIQMASGKVYAVKEPFPTLTGLKAPAKKAEAKSEEPGKEDVKEPEGETAGTEVNENPTGEELEDAKAQDAAATKKKPASKKK